MKCVHVLRKPCSEPTVAANVLRHGTGALNIEAARIPWASAEDADGARTVHGTSCHIRLTHSVNLMDYCPPASGRWPANLILGACMDAELDRVFPHTQSAALLHPKAGGSGTGRSFRVVRLDSRIIPGPGDSGSAARYFKRVGG